MNDIPNMLCCRLTGMQKAVQTVLFSIVYKNSSYRAMPQAKTEAPGIQTPWQKKLTSSCENVSCLKSLRYYRGIESYSIFFKC